MRLRRIPNEQIGAWDAGKEKLTTHEPFFLGTILTLQQVSSFVLNL